MEVKRFQKAKVTAHKVGDNTKPTRFTITVENRKDKDTVLVAEQFTLTDKEGNEKNAMNRKRKGYVKELKTSSSRRVGVGLDLYEVEKDDIIDTGIVYKGKNKRIIMNHIYNENDKKNKHQRNIVRNNKIKRRKYKEN